MVKREQSHQRMWMRRTIAITVTTLLLSSMSHQVYSQSANISLSPQFSPNPLVLRGTAGGSTVVTDLVKNPETPTGPCTGFASKKPNHSLTLSSFFKQLNVDVDSDQDTALVIRGPGGVWCNDDYQGKNPRISGEWLPGQYDIWVSTYSKNQSAPYTLKLGRN